MNDYKQAMRALRELRETNPRSTTYYLGLLPGFTLGTIYLAAVGSWWAIFCLVFTIFTIGVLAGAALYGKGTLRNAVRALWALARGRAFSS